MKKAILIIFLFLFSYSALALTPSLIPPTWDNVNANITAYYWILWNSSINEKGTYLIPAGSVISDAGGWAKNSGSTVITFNVTPKAWGTASNMTLYFEFYRDSTKQIMIQQGDYTDDNPYSGQWYNRETGMNFSWYNGAYNPACGWAISTIYHVFLYYDNANSKFNYYIISDANNFLCKLEALTFSADLRNTYSHSFKLAFGDTGTGYIRHMLWYNGTPEAPLWLSAGAPPAIPDNELGVLNSSYDRSGLFYEGDDLYFYSNYTLNGAEILGANCNFTAYNISFSGGLKSNGNITLSTSSPMASFLINEGNLSAIKNTMSVKLCKSIASANTITFYSNGSGIATFSAEIPLCSIGYHEAIFNASNRLTDNISAVYSGNPANSIKLINDNGYNMRFYRMFSNHAETMPYNITKGLYQFTVHPYAFEKSGLHGIDGLCNGTSDFLYVVTQNKNISASILSINDTTFINGTVFEAGDLSVIMEYGGRDLISFHTNITNTSNAVIKQYYTENFIINNSQMPKNGRYNIFGYAVDIDGNIAKVSGYFIINDTIKPIIDIITPNEDNTTELNYGASLTIESIARDLNLFAHELSLYSPNGTLIYSIKHEDINITTDTLSFPYSFNEAGAWFVTANSTDDHTAEEMNDIILDSGIKEDGAYMNVENTQITASDAIKCTPLKLKDKISYSCEYPKGLNEKEIYIKSNSVLTPRPYSKYKGLLVDYYNMLSYDMENDLNAPVTLYKISENEYKAVIETNADKINFNSIVGLNWAQKTAIINVKPLPPDYTLTNFNLEKQSNIILLLVISILYIGIMGIGFAFKNFGFISLGFIIGVGLGLMLSSIGIIMTLAFLFINITILITVVKKR